MELLLMAPRSHPHATMNSNSRMYSNLVLARASLFFYMKVPNRNNNKKKMLFVYRNEGKKMTLDGLFVVLCLSILLKSRCTVSSVPPLASAP